MTEELLPRLLAEAAAGLDEATGGAAVCASAKTADPAARAKYQEGRWAALREVDRKRRQDGHEATRAALEVQERWAARLDRLVARGAGPDWVAYQHGGLDALAELLAGSSS